jgi:hypothetical protein
VSSHSRRPTRTRAFLSHSLSTILLCAISQKRIHTSSEKPFHYRSQQTDGNDRFSTSVMTIFKVDGNGGTEIEKLRACPPPRPEPTSFPFSHLSLSLSVLSSIRLSYPYSPHHGIRTVKHLPSSGQPQQIPSLIPLRINPTPAESRFNLHWNERRRAQPEPERGPRRSRRDLQVFPGRILDGQRPASVLLFFSILPLILFSFSFSFREERMNMRATCTPSSQRLGSLGSACASFSLYTLISYFSHTKTIQKPKQARISRRVRPRNLRSRLHARSDRREWRRYRGRSDDPRECLCHRSWSARFRSRYHISYILN